MQFYTSDAFNLNLPPGHRFPSQKYRMLQEKLLADAVLSRNQLRLSPIAERQDLLRAHSADYVDAIETGSIDPAAMRRIGFPWSPHIPLRAKTTVGGAVAAARSALADGLSGQLAGGTHHAHRDFGAGYCVFNDFAVAALNVIAEGAARRVAIIDLDVHQGDGNAAILAENDQCFVLSLHGGKNFPFRKFPSDLDIPLDDGTQDLQYLEALERALPAIWAFGPDLLLYQAGVDPLAEDRLGRLSLTCDGLMARDEIVLRAARAQGVPVSMAIGGGYAEPIELSVEAYANTYKVAKRIYRF